MPLCLEHIPACVLEPVDPFSLMIIVLKYLQYSISKDVILQRNNYILRDLIIDWSMILKYSFRVRIRIKVRLKTLTCMCVRVFM